MNEEMKKITNWFFLLFMCLGVILGWTLHPDTKEVVTTQIANVKVETISVLAEKKEGKECWMREYRFGTTTERLIDCSGIITKEVSILAEKKRCSEWGGDFGAWSKGEVELEKPLPADFIRDTKIKIELPWRGHEITLLCTRPYSSGNITGTETLFEYELTN